MMEEPQQQSIQARIAALNLGQVGRAPITANTSPRPAPKPAFDQRRNTTNVPNEQNFSTSKNSIGNEPISSNRAAILPAPVITRTVQGLDQLDHASKPPPPRLPPRKASANQSQPSPALPPRRTSQQNSRRDSAESISSVVSTMSSMSALSNGTARTSASRAPSVDRPRLQAPVYDPSTLPPLPPKRSQEEKKKDLQRIPLKGTKSTPSIRAIEVIPAPTMPALPQRPAARERSAEPVRRTTEPARRLPPQEPPPMPARPLPPLTSNGIHDKLRPNGFGPARSPSPVPPPVPLASRPDISKLMATKPKLPSISPTPTVPAISATSCLKCRDFSGPDNHAAEFPRENVPSLDWLATQLTLPFPSATDKARAIFTWLHHNVDYDVDAFFNDRVQPSTPASTLNSGLAVCEGYAGLFTALATKAGLESIVIGGHGKGFGYQALAPDAPLPPETTGHAWNACKIDNGEWKLIDPCWGAGSLDCKDNRSYNRHFSPEHFTKDNDEFGISHFPNNKKHFYRCDGRAQISWEEYLLGDRGGEPVRIFNGVASEEGISAYKFLPKYLKLSTSPAAHAGPTVRFQFERVCPHFDPLVHGPGKPYLYLLLLAQGGDEPGSEMVTFDTNGRFWWADVPPENLGKSGQHITLFAVDTIGGQSGRGLTKEEFPMARRKGMSFKGLASWDLV